MEIQQLQAEMVRFQQALIEERSARQTIEEDLWKTIGGLQQNVSRLEEKCDRLIKATCKCQTKEDTCNLEQETCELQHEETSNRPQSDGEDVTTPPDDAPSKCDVIKSDDVTTGAMPARDNLTKSEFSGANIYHIHGTYLLKMVLSKLDCWEMIRAKQVCRSWRSAVDDIVDDCRRELADRRDRGGKAPEPATALQLVATVKDRPEMTSLKAPTAETDTDIRLVADSCHALQTADLHGFKLKAPALRRLARANASSLRELTLPAGMSDCQLEALLEPLEALETLNLSLPVDSTADSCHALQTADLRGFKLRVSALRRLARANASSLRELTLPAGISDWQLEALLEPLKALRELNLSLPVDSTGKWLWLLPKSLWKLDITGSGMTRSPVNYDLGKLSVGVQLATDKLLDQLSVLSNRQPGYQVITLTILESPSVTPGALARLLASLTSLKWVKLGVVGATSETTLAALHGCSGLEILHLTDPRPLTDIPDLTESEVAAVSRMAVTCRKLQYLYLTSSTVNCQAVLTALLKTDLGNIVNSSYRRSIYLYVPRAVEGQLSKPPDGSNVRVGYFKFD